MLVIKYLKMLFWSILILVVILIIGGILFVNLSPEFGGKVSEEKKLEYANSGYYEGGKFINPIKTEMNMSFNTFTSILRDYIKGIPNQKPANPIEVLEPDPTLIQQEADTIKRITWFGHSAFLLELADKKILIDPMFGSSPSPISFMGTKRFTEGLPLEVDELPEIDAVVLSHDHYDHLDYGSIMKLKSKVKAYYVPLGVGAHLKAWGIPDSSIFELNWWEEASVGEVMLVAAPARHFSGRGLTDRFSTFWSGWIIQAPDYKLFFSGDGGYGPHFREIGEKYGPFDFAMLECGQYDRRWSEIHMMPEESAQAARDVQAKIAMPIHWGAFVLALHSWYDPPSRFGKTADSLGVNTVYPRIGEVLDLANIEERVDRDMQNTWWAKLMIKE